MITLTIDPESFPGPEAAFRWVRDKRALANFVRDLRRWGCVLSEKWFAVVEFHKSGWPHFHLLVDAERIEHELICAAWDKYRPPSAGPVAGARPPFGAVKFSAPKFTSSDHAANYATKYLTKTPAGGWPDWVLDFDGQVRRYYCNRGLIKKSSPPRPKSNWGPRLRTKVQRRTLRQRLAGCDTRALFFIVEFNIDADGKELQRWKFGRTAFPRWHDCLQRFGLPAHLRRFFLTEAEYLQWETEMRKAEHASFSLGASAWNMDHLSSIA